MGSDFGVILDFSETPMAEELPCLARTGIVISDPWKDRRNFRLKQQSGEQKIN